MKKGDELELEISGYAYEGKGISKVHKQIIKPGSSNNTDSELANYVVFVNGSYPGDRVQAKLGKIKSSYSEAKLIDIIKPSKFRVKARCKYFGTCGGCKQQDLNYEMQLNYKQQQVKEIFEHIGRLTIFYLQMKTPFYFYRRKYFRMEEYFQFQNQLILLCAQIFP